MTPVCQAGSALGGCAATLLWRAGREGQLPGGGQSASDQLTGSSPLAWHLYSPESWTDDEKRCQQAGVPAPISFRKKWEWALDLIDKAFAWGLAPPPVLLADAGYGDITEFRRGLEKRQLPYAVAVTSQVRVWTESPPLTPYVPKRTGRPTQRPYQYGEQRPLTLGSVAETQQKRFRTVTWRKGTKGAMRSRFLAVRVQPAHGYVEGAAPGSTAWLLIEWPRAETAPTKYFPCDLPAGYSLRRLVCLTKDRYRVEQDYQQLKEGLGLDFTLKAGVGPAGTITSHW